MGFWQILLCVDCLTCLLVLFSWTQAGRMLAKRSLIITSNSYAHTKATYRNLFPYKVCKVKLSECSFRQWDSKLEKVYSRYSQPSLWRTPRCNGRHDNTLQKLQMFDHNKNLVIISRNLALTELQFLLLIGPNSKIFLSLQRTPRGTEGLRTVTGIFCFFKNVYIYINVFTAAIPVQKNNNLSSQV